MISKQQQKYVQSLHNKKYRNEYGLFLVEGEKNVLELLDSDFKIKEIYSSENFLVHLKTYNSSFAIYSGNPDQISAISTLKNQSTVVAVAYQKENKETNIDESITLVLDDIKDPGNLGTIIRIADWYGIGNIICSENTVEFYNPKVIAASMGSFCRVNVYYTDLSKYLTHSKIPVLGAFLHGKNIRDYKIENEKIMVVIGSESHGISENLASMITEKITIPAMGKAESLNAAVATGIILDNLSRLKITT